MKDASPHSLVLDVGKTNVKIHVLDVDQRSIAVEHRTNVVVDQAPYPHADVNGIWNWMVEVIAGFAPCFDVRAIAVTTHGATAALVDPALGGDGLVLPVLDYEWQGVADADAYDAIRPPFSETYSPRLPAGLNLARQLFWQQQAFPADFAAARAILTYPQYWTWRISGVMVSEVTSLGCHTDLWAPETATWSSLVHSQGWRHLFPTLVDAWEPVGNISSEFARITGLAPDCRVHAGIHDSNASFLRVLRSMPDTDFCVVSSGTWVICMSPKSPLGLLDETHDMLVNIDAQGGLVPCIRFMGGREYEEIRCRCGTDRDAEVTDADIAEIIANDIFALPDYSAGSGPFGGRPPEILGAPSNGNALATLYCALMVDYCLDLLQVEHSVILMGSYLQNPLLCSLIAQLRGGQPVYLSSDPAGTVRGTAQLTGWSRPVAVARRRCTGSEVSGLHAYSRKWRELASQRA